FDRGEEAFDRRIVELRELRRGLHAAANGLLRRMKRQPMQAPQRSGEIGKPRFAARPARGRSDVVQMNEGVVVVEPTMDWITGCACRRGEPAPGGLIVRVELGRVSGTAQRFVDPAPGGQQRGLLTL